MLETDVFGENNVIDFPKSYVISKPWEEMLLKAPKTAAALYNLGIIAFSRGDTVQARACFEQALLKNGGAPVHRALGRIDLLEGKTDEGLSHYKESINQIKGLRELDLEYATTLLQAEKYDELQEFLDSLEKVERSQPRFLYLQICCFIHQKRYDEAISILNTPLVIPDMREGELSLCDLWFHLFSEKEGIPKEEAEKKYPLPVDLDFRMH